MDKRDIRKTAILVDGGYYRKRSIDIWGKKSAVDRAKELHEYCLLHIQYPDEPRDLYRIFYYDCPPMSKKMLHPLTREEVNFALSSGYQWTHTFFQELSQKRKVALRMGALAENNAYFTLQKNTIDQLISKKKSINDLVENDFYVEVKQKGVDMRIGLDAASLAQGGYVNQIVLIAGDSDFIPVAKMARRNGIDFILDPMKEFPKKELLKHVDGIESYAYPSLSFKYLSKNK